MRGSPLLLALPAALTLTAGPALAADPTGDWIGVVQTSQEKVRIGLEIRATPGGYGGTYEDLTHEYRGVILPQARGAAPTFRLPSLYGTFVFNWDPSLGMWRGVWTDSGGAHVVILGHGAIPPAPAIPKPVKTLLLAMGVLMLVEAVGIARLLQLRRRRRLRLARA